MIRDENIVYVTIEVYVGKILNLFYILVVKSNSVENIGAPHLPTNANMNKIEILHEYFGNQLDIIPFRLTEKTDVFEW